MNNAARTFLLSGALALTIVSVCAAVFGIEAHAAGADAEISTPQGSGALSLSTLQGRLRETKAISLTGKLGLKIEIDRLVYRFRLAHGNGLEVRPLRQPYETLVTRIGLLLVRDPQLATDIAMSREAIWDVLADRTKFADLG